MMETVVGPHYAVKKFLSYNFAFFLDGRQISKCKKFWV